MRGPLGLALAVLVVLPTGVSAQGAVERARGLIARYDQDLTRIDRARELLEAELTRERPVEALVLAAYVQFLYGEVRATTADDKMAAYERGREWGQRAVELAPRNEGAHVWYAINTGRWGQLKGLMRALFLLPTMREEIDTILAINPHSVRGHALAANFLSELPGLFGGDRDKAEEHFRKALEIDPRFTVLRIDYARLLIAQHRDDEARRELRRVVDEKAPTNVADWVARDLPRARELLDSIKGRQ